MWQRMMLVTLLLGGLAGLESCLDDSAARDAALVQRKVAAVRADDPGVPPRPARRARPDEPDPCDGVSEADVARVEAQMRELNRDLVVFGGEEMRALRCSRSRAAR